MAKDDDTWYLVWPDRIEPISWREYRAGNRQDRDNWIHARGPFPSHQEAVAWMHYDMLSGYWNHGLPVRADHCLECGAWAKVLAFDNAAGGWAWRVTECKKCGVIDSRNLEHWIYVTHKGVWCRCGAHPPTNMNRYTWEWRHIRMYKSNRMT